MIYIQVDFASLGCSQRQGSVLAFDVQPVKSGTFSRLPDSAKLHYKHHFLGFCQAEILISEFSFALSHCYPRTRHKRRAYTSRRPISPHIMSRVSARMEGLLIEDDVKTILSLPDNVFGTIALVTLRRWGIGV